MFIIRGKARAKGTFLFIITEEARAKERKWDGVGVMKDKEFIETWGCQDPSYTWLSIILLLLYIDSTEEVVNLFKVELQKPRNLSASESEGRGHGEGVGVYATLVQSDTL